jgi:hypothetical protein
MTKASLSRRKALVASAGMVLAASMPSSSMAETPSSKDIDAGVSVAPEDAGAIWAVLDKYLEYFRPPLADTIDETLKTMLFPHVRVASHQIVVFPDAKTYKDVSLNQTGDYLPPGWDHTDWGKRRIVQADKEKAHVVVVLSRYTKDKKLIAAEDSFYILEKVDGHWGIRGRSSFAK